ncbi:hypothetical protein HK102_003897 [Quaeritorhiza haematococci]|nr:hypothetical protein HK102_003897 [Quaeritorhiza haematococci]
MDGAPRPRPPQKNTTGTKHSVPSLKTHSQQNSDAGASNKADGNEQGKPGSVGEIGTGDELDRGESGKDVREMGRGKQIPQKRESLGPLSPVVDRLRDEPKRAEETLSVRSPRNEDAPSLPRRRSLVPKSVSPTRKSASSSKEETITSPHRSQDDRYRQEGILNGKEVTPPQSQIELVGNADDSAQELPKEQQRFPSPHLPLPEKHQEQLQEVTVDTMDMDDVISLNAPSEDEAYASNTTAHVEESSTSTHQRTYRDSSETPGAPGSVPKTSSFSHVPESRSPRSPRDETRVSPSYSHDARSRYDDSYGKERDLHHSAPPQLGVGERDGLLRRNEGPWGGSPRGGLGDRWSPNNRGGREMMDRDRAYTYGGRDARGVGGTPSVPGSNAVMYGGDRGGFGAGREPWAGRRSEKRGSDHWSPQMNWERDREEDVDTRRESREGDRDRNRWERDSVSTVERRAGGDVRDGRPSGGSPPNTRDPNSDRAIGGDNRRPPADANNTRTDAIMERYDRALDVHLQGLRIVIGVREKGICGNGKAVLSGLDQSRVQGDNKRGAGSIAGGMMLGIYGTVGTFVVGKDENNQHR